MSSCVRNICTKNYQNVVVGFQVTVKNVWDVFFETQYSVHVHACKLQSYRTSSEMSNEFLLQILPRRGPWAFEKFLECLIKADENMVFIAAELDPTAPARYADA